MLITAGSVSSTAGDARVFEVTQAEGEVVWELQFPAGIGVYRSDRITPPLVHARGKSPEVQEVLTGSTDTRQGYCCSS